MEPNTSGRLIQEESKSEGAVALHVYQAYWRAMGSGLASAILISLLLMQGEMLRGSSLLPHLHRMDPQSCCPGAHDHRHLVGITTKLRTFPSTDNSWDKRVPQFEDSRGQLDIVLYHSLLF